MLKYINQSVGYSSGFNPSAPLPLDVRMVVDTLADRNAIEYIYPSMPVTVLGASVIVAGVRTYPNMTHWVCLVEKGPAFGGPTTQDQDWKLDSAPSSLTSGGYKGPVHINELGVESIEIVPNLNDMALRATLKPGDFFKVGFIVANAAQVGYNIDGITELATNDSVFWNGTKFDRFQNTNPQAINPLYDTTEGARFLADVLEMIRLSALTEWRPGTDYGFNAYVSNYYQEDGKDYVDTWVALAGMTAATAALPTELQPNPLWKLVTTTNGRRLGGTATANDERGRAATGTFAPTSRSKGEFLTPEETDARIKQYAGNNSGPILGGDAATFLTADPLENARN